MELSNNNLKIRAARPDDSKLLCSWWNDGTIMAHAGFPNGLGTNEKKVARSIRQNNENNRRLIIEYKNTPVGSMNYQTPEENIAEIGIEICDTTMQNRGFGTEYLNMLIGYLFNKRGYVKIILNTNLKNRRAQHVYEKIGFQKTGTKINSWKDRLGKYQSAVYYELTPAAFQKKEN